ncbi:MAG: hypothetical protein ACI4MI_00095 [Christensenellales bacterium]
MSTKRKSISLLLILLAVVLISATVLCFGCNNLSQTDNLPVDVSDSIVVQTAEPVIELEPVFIAAEDNIITGKTEHVLNDDNSIGYKGVVSDQWYKFEIKWNDPNSNVDIDYVITFKDSEGNDMGYKISYVDGSFINEKTTVDGTPPCKAGEYTINVAIDNENYYIDPSKASVQLTITKFVINVQMSQSNRIKTYNGKSFWPTVSADVSSAPDSAEDLYGFVYYQYVDGAYVELEGSPVNVGSYKIGLSVSNPNYDYIFDDSEGRFSIIPCELNVNYVIPSNLQYDGQVKNVVGEVSGWKYNMQTEQTDTANCELVITYNDVVVSEIKTVGTYILSMTCDNPNYYIARQESIEITKKPAQVNYIVDNNVVYDGQTHIAQAVMTGIVDGDDVSLEVQYNASTVLPCNAGRYELSCVFYGADKDNYSFEINQSNAYINIDKAEYAIDDFEIRLYDIKILVIETDFGDIKTVYSIDGIEWQDSNTITALPMQEYVVRVKLLGDENHKEKILSKTVRTGFDAVLFDDMMKDIDLSGFSFKDVAAYREVERCLGYVAEGTMEENVDVEYLQRLRAAYSDYKQLANDVAQEACGLSGAIGLQYMMGAAALGVASALVIRRKKNEI